MTSLWESQRCAAFTSAAAKVSLSLTGCASDDVLRNMNVTDVTFQVLMAVSVNLTVLWGAVPCSLIEVD
jgi:hypothetical protein